MKTIDSFEFGAQRVGKATYDWDMILDGEIRVLEAGKDFTCKPANIKTQARTVAKKRGLRVRTGSTEDGNVVIQAYSPDVEVPTEPTEPTPTSKAKKSRQR